MKTNRITLRPWQESDAETLFKYASDPEVGPRAGWPVHKSLEESLDVIRNIFTNDHTWAIELNETGEAIGCIGYYPSGESNIGIGEDDAEIGYWVAKPYWNKGICTEALRLMIDYCFNVKGFHTLGVIISLITPLPAESWRNAASKTPARSTGAANSTRAMRGQ